MVYLCQLTVKCLLLDDNRVATVGPEALWSQLRTTRVYLVGHDVTVGMPRDQ